MEGVKSLFCLVSRRLLSISLIAWCAPSFPIANILLVVLTLTGGKGKGNTPSQERANLNYAMRTALARAQPIRGASASEDRLLCVELVSRRPSISRFNMIRRRAQPLYILGRASPGPLFELGMALTAYRKVAGGRLSAQSVAAWRETRSDRLLSHVSLLAGTGQRQELLVCRCTAVDLHLYAAQRTASGCTLSRW